MEQLSWRDAIKKVLRDENGPLHYSEIAQRILDEDLRQKAGATPADTVAATISVSMKDDLVRVDRGTYTLALSASSDSPTGEARPAEILHESEEDDHGFLNAFGMFWRRDEVDWEKKGKRLEGSQLKAADSINFAEQVGVYILYSGDRVIYVGRDTKPRLGERLWEHTGDRLAGRWDRFSWFGVRAPTDAGDLGPIPEGNFAAEMLVATMEALLIEGLEPPQNRQRGKGFNAIEFIQTTDPDLEKARTREALFGLLQSADRT